MNKVKWGVIGAGGIADRRTIPGLLLAENAELTAVMEVNMDLAESLRKKYNAKFAYDSVEMLLSNNEIDAVYIATPAFLHKRQAIAAAAAKKHILLEKPLGLTADEGAEIAKACRDNGVLLAAGFMMRYGAYHSKMKELVGDGRLGTIVSCRAQLTCWYPDIEGSWRQQKALSGGGALMDMGIHCIDLLQYIMGAKVNKVAALTGTKTFNYEVDDSASLLLNFDNGAYGYVDSNFNIPDAAAKCRIEVYGTRGSMLAEGTISQVDGGKLEVVIAGAAAGYDAQQDRADAVPVTIEVEFGNMYTKEIQSFGDSILNGKPVEASADEAVFAQRVVEAAYQSSETGQFVDLRLENQEVSRNGI